MNTQSIRRSIFTALLVTPLSVLAQTSPTDKATSSASSAHPDLRSGKLEYKLTPEQLQAIMSRATNVPIETALDEPLSGVVISGKEQTSTATKLPIAVRPCGLTSVVWFINHPAEGWRMFTPIAANSELNVCLKTPVTAVLLAYPQR